jgi:hypothetical protein
MNTVTTTPHTDLPLVERLRIVSLAEASRLSGISIDGIRRHHAEKLIRLSPRRLGIRLGDALLLNANAA